MSQSSVFLEEELAEKHPKLLMKKTIVTDYQN